MKENTNFGYKYQALYFLTLVYYFYYALTITALPFLLAHLPGFGYVLSRIPLIFLTGLSIHVVTFAYCWALNISIRPSIWIVLFVIFIAFAINVMSVSVFFGNEFWSFIAVDYFNPYFYTTDWYN